MKIEFYKHNISEAEKQSVLAVLDSIFLTTGRQVHEFERQLCEYTGAGYAVGVTSCTAALHLSLLALGVGAGDEVITTPMTFVATSLAILHVGAKPVWVDVEKGTGNIDAALIESAINAKTKAIIPVHLYGQMADMRAIRKIADKYELFIIEDAAHALESRRDDIRVGELGDAACFSFYATKSITSGEGGAVTTNSKKLAEKIKSLRTHGINADAADRYTGAYRHWDLLEIGWKYNMDNIQAALLIPQLKKADCFRQKRESVYNKYKQALTNVPELKIPHLIPNSVNGHHLFTIWVDPQWRDSILKGLQKKEIGVAVNYRAIHLLSKLNEIFQAKRGSFPNAEHIGDSTISLPFYPKLQDQEIDYIARCLKDILSG